MAINTDRSTTLECQRHKFAIPPAIHYLNCAYMAPVSNAVAEAAQLAISRLRAPSLMRTSDFFEPSDAVRHLFAELIGVDDPTRIAIVPSVSYAMATLARNTTVRSGENIVVVHEQFPSNVYSWQRLCASTGAELRTVRPPSANQSRGSAWNTALLNAIDSATAVVAIPELHWTDGTKFDLERIGARARACGARFILDGTQSVGALPFDVTRSQPDAVVCAGYKWLMGPYSVGLAYFGPAYDDGIPLEENWIARLGSEDFSGLVRYREEYQPGAIRYDMGERSNFVLLPMLAAGLTQVTAWGPEAIQNHCRRVSEGAVQELTQLGCRIEDDDRRAAHLFGVRLPSGFSVVAMQTALSERGVSVSVRGSALRVSPHVYNDAADLAALVAAVRGTIDPSRPSERLPPVGR